MKPELSLFSNSNPNLVSPVLICPLPVFFNQSDELLHLLRRVHGNLRHQVCADACCLEIDPLEAEKL